ncbi:LamG domain-containing protein [Ochrovirga pacifica]|uniref:glycoside hydrolase n=1 Tax=Ochrovirga pacifica TaxID=1042376 RepID=UPI0002557FAE|nr:glycoside hydrolase [Ochrovirga pacifica]
MIKRISILFFGAILFSSCSKENEGFIPPSKEIEQPIDNEELGTDASVPTFLEGEDPNTSANTWTKVELLSDEFDSTTLNTNKWAVLVNTWIGRPPGIFKEDAVSLSDDNLKVTNYKLPEKEIVNGNEYTHAGSLIRSVNTAKSGMYFECRMKASKTFMSSTFWLINTRNEGSGCDQRTTELDIQETVGRISETVPNWASDHDSGMFSNTHSRNKSCDETKEGSAGASVKFNNKSWEGYHIYAAWWKSPTEILFFLDGEYQSTVNPKERFDLPMYLRMVTETYDWNPVPADGGLTGTTEERTTYYDWVRTWELK